MKQTFTLLFALLSVVFHLTVQAQPILTVDNSAPKIGQEQSYEWVELNGLSAGPSGENVTWDFSTITSPMFIGSMIGVLPNETPFGSLFPTADIAYDTDGSFAYYNLTPYSYNFLGYGGVDFEFIYSNPETQFVYPFTYGTSQTDAFFATVHWETGTETQYGTTTLIGDGYGTLILPSGSYSNVLRIRTITDYIDSTASGGFPNMIHHFFDFYTWHSPTEGPLLTLGTTTTTFIGGTSSQSFAKLIHWSAVGIPNLQAEPLNVYPNPATEQLYIDLPTDVEQNATLNVYDLAGRRVKTTTVAQSERQTISVDELPTGTYMLTLRSADKVWRQKVNVIC